MPLFVAECLAGTQHQLAAPTSHIQKGTLIRKYIDSYKQDVFLGIPFAQPPIGHLRFNAPQPVSKTWKHPLNATVYAAYYVNYLNPLAC